jgi:hypothetical protein
MIKNRILARIIFFYNIIGKAKPPSVGAREGLNNLDKSPQGRASTLSFVRTIIQNLLQICFVLDTNLKLF